MVESRGNPSKIETERVVETVHQGWKGHHLQTTWYATTPTFLVKGTKKKGKHTHPIVDPPAQQMGKNEKA